MKKPTINDVARIANVSKKTVSRVINASPDVTASTRARVQAAAKELNYTPDPQARGLNTKRSYLIGLVYDNPNALYISDIQKGVLKACQGTGYELIMHPGEFASKQLVNDISFFVSRARLDGLILMSPISQLGALASKLKSSDCPYVRISPRKIDRADRVVVSNDRKGAVLMAEHLIGLGHRDIGFILGPSSNLSSKEKYGGFLSAMKEHQVPVLKRLLVQGENTFESGVAASKQLLARQRKPTAIFASNDQMALGVLKTAQMLGVQVPGQLSVAGYDDSEVAAVVWPDLTTVHLPVEHLGELAARKLITRLSPANPASAVDVFLEPTLVPRNSTAPPNVR